jgi:hypothetical protein
MVNRLFHSLVVFMVDGSHLTCLDPSKVDPTAATGNVNQQIDQRPALKSLGYFVCYPNGLGRQNFI